MEKIITTLPVQSHGVRKSFAIFSAFLAVGGSAMAQVFSSDWTGVNGTTGGNDYSVVQENNASYNYNNWGDEVVGNGQNERSGFAVSSLDGGVAQVATLTYNVGVKVSPPNSGFGGTAGYGDGYSINFGPSINGDGARGGALLSAYDKENQGLSIDVHTYGGDGNFNNALIFWDGTQIGQINGIGASGTQDLVDTNTTISATGALSVNILNASTSFDQTFTANLGDWTTENNSQWAYTIASFSGGAAEINEVGSEYIATTPAVTSWNGNGDWVNTPSNWSNGVPTNVTFSVIQSGTLTVSTGGTSATALDTDNFANVDIVSGGVLTSSTFENEVGATLTIASGGTLDVANAFTFHGGSTLTLGDGVDFTPGSVVLSGATMPAIITVNGSDTATIGAVISDSPAEADSLVKTGTGTLILNQVNTYSGGTTINGGTVQINGDAALGNVNGGLTIDGGTLQFAAATTLAATRSITLQGPSGGTFDTDGNNVTIASSITGAGDFVKAGTGTLTLTGSDSGNGTVTVAAGTLQLNPGGDMPNVLSFTIMSNGTLCLNGGTLNASASISNSGNLTLNGNNLSVSQINGGGNINLGSGTLTVAGGGLESGIVSGVGGAIAVAGGSAFELDGANTYSGGTTLTSGTLIAGNATALGTGPLQVNGGALTVGNSNHMISVGSFTQTGGMLLLKVAGTGQSATADLLHVTNTAANQVSLGGNLTINLSGFTVAPVANGLRRTYTFNVVDTDAGYTGTFASFDPLGLRGGLTASLDYATTPDDVLLQIVQTGSSFSFTGLAANQQAILLPINHGFEAGNTTPGLVAVENALSPFSGTPAALGAALNQLSPQAFAQFGSETAFNNASFETESEDTYLAGRRQGPAGTFAGGNGNIDTSGLTINDPSYDPSLALVHSRLLAWSPAPSGALCDMATTQLGGISMVDPKDMTSKHGSDFSDPWNFYVQGNVILAQGFSDANVSHYNGNTESVALGADYRLSPKFLVGLRAAYGHSDATLDNNGSSATVDSYSPGFYASYADKGWYANLSGNYAHNAYTQSRVIGILSQTASSAPEGNQGTADLDGGYDFHHGALTLGPLAGVQYTHLTVDGYSESGSVADLSVNAQNADSLRTRLGGRISYLFSRRGFNLTPHLDASWQHEFMDQSRGVTSQFESAGIGSFSIKTTNPSRDSALVDAGLSSDLNQSITIFADYNVQAGQDNYFGQSVDAGVKIGF